LDRRPTWTMNTNSANTTLLMHIVEISQNKWGISTWWCSGRIRRVSWNTSWVELSPIARKRPLGRTWWAVANENVWSLYTTAYATKDPEMSLLPPLLPHGTWQSFYFPLEEIQSRKTNGRSPRHVGNIWKSSGTIHYLVKSNASNCRQHTDVMKNPVNDVSEMLAIQYWHTMADPGAVQRFL